MTGKGDCVCSMHCVGFNDHSILGQKTYFPRTNLFSSHKVYWSLIRWLVYLFSILESQFLIMKAEQSQGEVTILI